MDSYSLDRNPSPPRELADQTELIGADNIGDTVFSKHWLFVTLMKLIEEVDKHEVTDKESEFSLDVDEGLQDELCKLWDMSMTTDVVKFLQEFKAVDILTGVIAKSQAPRVTEICIGILGNMSCNPSVCVDMSKNEKLVDVVMMLLDNPDAPTLVETTRLLYACIATPDACKPWISAIKTAPDILSKIQFILSSSTNDDLLGNVGEFLDKLLDVDDELCKLWATDDMILALLEALKQIGFQPSSNLDTYLHIFQLLSTTEPGVQSLVHYAEEVSVYLMQYLVVVCDDPVIGLRDNESSLSSTLSVLNVLIMDSPDSFTLLNKDAELIRCLLKILDAVTILVKSATDKEGFSDNVDNAESTASIIEEKDQKSEKELTTNDRSSPARTKDKCDSSIPTEAISGEKRRYFTATATSSIETAAAMICSPDSIATVTRSIDSISPVVKASQLKTDSPSVPSSFLNPRRTSVSPSPKPSTGTSKCTPSNHNSPAPSTFEGTYQPSRLLYQIIQGFLEDITEILHKPAPCPEDSRPRFTMPIVLDYIDVHCPRNRIINMLQSLSKSEKPDKGLLTKWNDISSNYGLNRLADILEQFQYH